MLTDDDWLAVRSLISHVTGEGPPGIGWDVRRWDGKRYHRTDHEEFLGGWSERVHLWWDGGDLVGAAHPEGPVEAHFQVRAGYRHLQDEMLDWAMSHLAHEGSLAVFCMDHDSHLRRLLGDRRFTDAGWGGVSRYLTFGPESPSAAAGAEG